ncbi:FKBP-type peptidyl-prolyl cis-trans isomerase [Nocardioides sp. GCM10027113]|uniref:FKBP-type peptidyl-prolyl cis-trans isomerase n=1 Tax=unclassified Nocardioides TaxID=2615069 RepID=UPI00361371D2
MFRRTLRAPRLVLPLALLLGLGLSSCGEEDTSGEAPTFEAVTVEGEPGSEPKVEIEKNVDTSEVSTEVLVEGEGEVVEAGDQVLAHLWLGNFFDQQKAFSTYDTGTPELVTVDEETLSPVFVEGLEGQTVGSRVAVTAPADEAFGEGGNPQFNIGNKDTILVVIDLMSTVLDEPAGESGKAPGWAPEIVEKDGVPASLDFSDAPKPGKDLRSATLVEGEGATVEKGQTIVVDYLGQVYGGKKPFDDSYSRGEPASFQIGTGNVVKGWDRTLVGATVGSRVMIAIPPALGYGKAGNPQAGIEGDDTLYFVVDVLAAG